MAQKLRRATITVTKCDPTFHEICYYLQIMFRSSTILRRWMMFIEIIDNVRENLKILQIGQSVTW